MNSSNAELLAHFLSLSFEELFSEYTLSGEKLAEYKVKLATFESENGSSSITIAKGAALEKLVVFLAENTNLFEIIPNIRTSTNEIDALLRTKTQAKPLLNKFFGVETDILFECKNYNEKVNVTWVGKFHSLLRNQNCNFGVIFSYEGFTGNRWDAAKGLTKKIYLRDKIIILDFNYSDFKELESGGNFLEIIRNKIDTIKNDTIHEINSYCIEHEAEKMLSQS